MVGELLARAARGVGIVAMNDSTECGDEGGVVLHCAGLGYGG